MAQRRRTHLLDGCAQWIGAEACVRIAQGLADVLVLQQRDHEVVHAHLHTHTHTHTHTHSESEGIEARGTTYAGRMAHQSLSHPSFLTPVLPPSFLWPHLVGAVPPSVPRTRSHPPSLVRCLLSLAFLIYTHTHCTLLPPSLPPIHTRHNAPRTHIHTPQLPINLPLPVDSRSTNVCVLSINTKAFCDPEDLRAWPECRARHVCVCVVRARH